MRFQTLIMKPLKSLEIRKLLLRDYNSKQIFKGVLSRDQLLSKVKYPSAYVVNTKPLSHPGEHWFAIYYNEDKEATFFDSYGQHPSYYKMVPYLNKTSVSWTFNNTQIQGILSSTCGYYCIYFILLMSRGLCLEHIAKEFNKQDFDLNDFKISLLIN